MNKEVSKVTTSIPNAFYDLIAYIVPSVIFITSLINEKVIDLTKINFEQRNSDTSFVYDLLIGLLVLGILYAIGVVIATFSYYIIKRPIIRYLKWRNHLNQNTKSDFGTLMLELQQDEKNHVHLEMVKKHARVILLRNLALTFPLIILCKVLTSRIDNLGIYIALFLILYFAYFFRHNWFLDNIQQIKEKRTDNKV